jgi:hypothetical protein
MRFVYKIKKTFLNMFKKILTFDKIWNQRKKNQLRKETK